MLFLFIGSAFSKHIKIVPPQLLDIWFFNILLWIGQHVWKSPGLSYYGYFFGGSHKHSHTEPNEEGRTRRWRSWRTLLRNCEFMFTFALSSSLFSHNAQMELNSFVNFFVSHLRTKNATAPQKYVPIFFLNNLAHILTKWFQENESTTSITTRSRTRHSYAKISGIWPPANWWTKVNFVDWVGTEKRELRKKLRSLDVQQTHKVTSPIPLKAHPAYLSIIHWHSCSSQGVAPWYKLSLLSLGKQSRGCESRDRLRKRKNSWGKPIDFSISLLVWWALQRGFQA